MNKYKNILILSIVLGTYTVPSFIYFFIPLLLFYAYYFFKENKSQLIPLVRIVAYSTLIIILLYLPVWIVSGNYEFLYQYIPVESSHITDYFIKLYASMIPYLFGTAPLNYIFLMLFLSSLLIGIFQKSHRWFVLLTLLIFAFPGLSFIIQKQVFPPRIFIHCIIFCSVITGMLISRLAENGFIFAGLMLLLPFYLIHNTNTSGFQKHTRKLEQVAENISAMIIKEDKKTIFLNNGYMKPLIEYHTKIHHHPIQLTLMKGLYRKNIFDSSIPYDVIIWPTKNIKKLALCYTYDTVYADDHIVINFLKAR